MGCSPSRACWKELLGACAHLRTFFVCMHAIPFCRYFFNCPSFFSVFWNIAKGFLDPVTQAKMRIMGTGCYDQIVEELGAENLPPEVRQQSLFFQLYAYCPGISS